MHYGWHSFDAFQVTIFWGTLPNARPIMQMVGSTHQFACAPPSSHLRLLLPWVLDLTSLHKHFWLCDGWTHFLAVQLTLERSLSHRSTLPDTARTSEGQAEKWPCYFLLSTWYVTQPLKQRKGAPAGSVSHRATLVLPGTLGPPGDQIWWIKCLMSLPSTEIKLQMRNYFNLLPTIKYRNYYFHILFRRII